MCKQRSTGETSVAPPHILLLLDKSFLLKATDKISLYRPEKICCSPVMNSTWEAGEERNNWFMNGHRRLSWETSPLLAQPREEEALLLARICKFGAGLMRTK